MLTTFCRLAAGRAGVLLRRRHRLPLSSSSSADRSSAPDHDYLALHAPDPPPPPSPSSTRSPDPARTAGTAAADSAASVDELAARLRQTRRGRPGQEAVIAASFGVIRLDSDNWPLVHGQFEPGLYGDGEGERNPELAAAMADRQTPDRPPQRERRHDDGVSSDGNDSSRNDRHNNGRYSDDINGSSINSSKRSGKRSGSGFTEDPQMSGGGRQRRELDMGDGESRGSSAAAAGVPPAAFTAAAASSDAVAPSVTAPRHGSGYVDGQYFPDFAVGERPLVADAAVGREPGSLLSGRLSSPPADVFDEQYFAAAFEPETAPISASSPLRGPLEQARPLEPLERDVSPVTAGGGVSGEKLDGRPEGVFEEQYFWAAFEDTDDHRKTETYKAGLTAKYARGAGGQPVAGAAAEDRGRHRDESETGERQGDAERDQGVRRNPRSSVSLPEDSAIDLAPPAAPLRSPPPPPSQPSSRQQQTGASPAAPAGRRSALEVVREMRAAAAAARPETTNRGRQLRAELTDLAALPSSSVLSLLRRGVLHDAEDLVILYKPAGLSVHSATERHPHCLTEHLPALARHLHCEQLLTVHRLDRDTSGALMLAKTTEAARRLSDHLREGRVVKSYWALVRGEPDLPRGVVDIPLVRAEVGGLERMSVPSAGGGATPPGAHRAVTRYRVLSRGGGCALLELIPATGVRHQLRVHLGLGLGCPVLGDHKYSRWDTAARPQRLPPAALAALGLRAPEARHLPLHLHARALWLPGLEHRVTAPLPLFFKRNLRRLKMAAGKVKVDGSNYGKGG